MEYTVLEILTNLGKVINKIQTVRNAIPVEMKRGDARHVAFGGIQTSMSPLMLSYGAVECANQCIDHIELSKISGLKNQSNEEILKNFNTWAKLTLLVFTHFRIEGLFSNILLAIDNTHNDKLPFGRKVKDLFNRLTLGKKVEKSNCLKAFSILRNSLHNNSINKNGDFDEIIDGRHFKFIDGEPTQATIFDIIFLIDYSIDIIKDIVNSPEVLNLPSPIQDLFHIKLSYL